MMRSFVIPLVLVCLGLTTEGQGVPRGTTSPSVIDAQGRFVGEVIGVRSDNARSYGVVRFELSANDSVMLAMSRVNGQLTWVREVEVYFESANCTGTPLLLERMEQFTERLGAVLPGSSLFLSDPNPVAASVIARSDLNTLGVCSHDSITMGQFIRLNTEQNLESNFSHPFRLVEGRSRPVR